MQSHSTRPRLSRRWLLRAALAAVPLLAATPALVRSVSEEDIDAAQLEKERVEQEKREQAVLLEATRAREGALQQQLAGIDRDRYAAIERLRTVQRELETIELEVFDINQSIAHLNRALAGETRVLESKVRSLYKASRTSILETVLSADSFSDALDRVAMLERILAQDVADIDSLLGSRREVQLRTADLRARLDRMEALRAEAATIEVELAKRAEEQRDLIFGVQRQQAVVESDLAAFQAEAAAIGQRIAVLRDIRQRELDELERRRRVAEARQAARELARELVREQGASAPGVYIWPLLGLITTEFGGCTFGQCPHIGMDIAASMGTPVVAANDGVVLAAGLVVPGNRRASYGMIVVVAHSQTEETLYAHLDDLTSPPPVSPGQFVSRGQTIGYVGLTGWTSGPHLHFEYRVNGVAQNPLNVLS